MNQVGASPKGTVTKVTIYSWWSASVTAPNIALAWAGGSQASSAQGAAVATLGPMTFAGPPSQAVRDALAELWVIFEYTVKLQVP